MANERPDWCEYWPIRKFFGETPLDPNRFYGFLSPRFGEKTGLTSKQVSELVKSAPENLHVLNLSPFSDHASLFWNVFEQAEAHHHGFMSASDQFAGAIGLNVMPSAIVNTSRDTIFCNYFLAKPAFWSQWLQIANTVFDIIESNQSSFAKVLSGETNYKNSFAPMKVFLIERIASYLLATDRQWRVASLPPFTLPNITRGLDHLHGAFVTLDALKISYRETNCEIYRSNFFSVRSQIGFRFALNS